VANFTITNLEIIKKSENEITSKDFAKLYGLSINTVKKKFNKLPTHILRDDCLERIVKKWKPARFLEIGPGSGLTTILFLRMGFWGACFEASAESRPTLTTNLQSYIEKIEILESTEGIVPKSFDYLFSFDVIEHIEEDEAVLLQMFQATKQGGGIMLTVPQHRFLWSAVDEHSFHKRRYTRQELIAKVERAGFRIIYIISFVSLMLPLLILSRARRRKTSKKFDLMAELKIGTTLNWTLERIMDFERAIIKLGISLPFGGSLLLLATKQH